VINRPSSFTSSLQSQSILNDFVFIFLTALFLWVPIQFSGSYPIPLQSFGICALAVLLTVRYYLSLDDAERRINLFSYGMIIYALWVLISAGMHYWALNSLAPEAYLSTPKITALKTDEYWAMWTLYHMAQIHLFFLSFLLISIVIFRSTETGWKKLTWIPLIFIPCLLVALYQSYVDADFLNNRLEDLMGGLGTDLSAFRNSLFMILPLCVLIVIIAQCWWKKILYGFMAAVILWLGPLSYGRIVIVGMLLFAFAIPMVGAWVHGIRSDKGRRYLYAGAVWTFALALFTGIAVSKFDSSMSELVGGRARVAIANTLKGDFIVEASDRIELLREGWRLIKLSPIAGWGPGGYLRNVDKIRFINGDPFLYYQYQYVPNLYLDWGTDLGLLGTCVIFFLYVMPLWMILRVRKRIQMREERWAVGIVFATLAIIFLINFNVGPYTHFPEGQWIFVVYLGFLTSVALKYGYTIPPIKGWLWGVGGLLLTVIFIAGTYRTTFGSKGYEAIQAAVLKPYKSIHGYYADYHGENWAGEKVQWMKKNTVSTVKASSNILQFKVLVPPRNSLGRDVLRLNISINDKPLDERHFFKGGEYNQYYHIPGVENKTVEIRTTLSQTPNPYRGDVFNFEGIVQPVAFMKAIPEDGIGFYPWEKMGKRRPPGWPEESKTERIRWTGIQATMNISANLRKVGIIYLNSLHPELDRYPVVLDILGDGRVIRREKFRDYNKWVTFKSWGKK